MERIRTQTIVGGQLEARQDFQKVLDGRDEIPFDLAAKLFLQIGRMLRHPLCENYRDLVRAPLADAVTLLWRIKEIEQAGLGEAGASLFRESVDQSGVSVRKQMQTVRRLDEKYGVDLHGNNLAAMRGAAMHIVARMHADLQSWEQSVPDLYHDDQLMGTFLAEQCSLYWGLLINLCLLLRQLHGNLEAMLADLSFSLEMIGSPVQVNQRMVTNLTLSLGNVLNSLAQLKKEFGSNGKALWERGRLEKLLDRNYIYPPYHLLLAESVRRAVRLLGNRNGQTDDFDQLPNFQAMKKNYLYRACSEAVFVPNFLREGGRNDPGSTEIPGPDGLSITYQQNQLDEFFPERLLSLARSALESSLVEESELLLRTRILAANQIEVQAHGRQEEYFNQWKRMERQIESQREQSRRSALRLIK